MKAAKAEPQMADLQIEARGFASFFGRPCLGCLQHCVRLSRSGLLVSLEAHLAWLGDGARHG